MCECVSPWRIKDSRINELTSSECVSPWRIKDSRINEFMNV